MPTTFDSLAPNPKNPRTITPKKKAMLKAALERFGDLGGVVFNRRTRRLVGGHQRCEAIRAMSGVAKVTIERAYETATPTGTVEEGYLEHGGERYAYRSVDWPENVEAAANLAANKGAGDFDLSLLQQTFAQLDMDGFNLELTMFDDAERQAMRVPDGNDDGFDDQLDKLPDGDGEMKTVTFTLSLDQHATLMQRIEEAKAMGDFGDTGNSNANGNALARIAEMFRG